MKIITVSILMSVSLYFTAGAQSTWDGGGTLNSAWGINTNWLGDVLPTFNNTTDLIFYNPGSVSNATEISGARTIRSLNFNTYADSAVSISFCLVNNGSARDLTMGGGSGGAAIMSDAGAAGSFSLGAGVAKGNLILASHLEIAHNGTGSLSIERPITGAFAISNNGSGLVIFSGVSTYSGGTFLNAGTLVVNTNGTLGTGLLTIAGGTLSSTLGSVLINSINMVSTGTVKVASGKVLTLSGTITNAGGLIKTDIGVLVLSGANAYSGRTLLNNGTLVADNNSALGSGLLVMGGGTLSNTVGSTLGNSINMISNGTIGVINGKTLMMSGSFTNIGSLTKTGPGALVLSSSNTFSGGTTVSAGTLQAGTDYALGSGNVTVENGAVLMLTGGSANTYLADAANLILGSNAALDLNFTGTADVVGGISLDGGATWLSGGIYNAAALRGRGTGAYTGAGSLRIPGGTVIVPKVVIFASP
jgi:fibronectin-binding autotransporter adhesin